MSFAVCPLAFIRLAVAIPLGRNQIEANCLS